MNRKLLGLALAITFLSMLVAPVIAKSPNKVPVAAFVDGMVPNFDNMVMRVTGGVVHLKDIVLAGPLSIFVDDDPTPIPVSYVNDPCGIFFNPKAGENGMSLMVFHEVWTLEGGTFAGTSCNN